ncbi:MAG: Fic family protein [Patescibacteria group bacterium]|nr:Fic family protein [Patescibacteria group bacterium]
MIKLSQRQKLILDFIRKNNKAQNKNIKERLQKEKIEISRFSIARDLNFLLKNNLITKSGQGRGLYYSELLLNKLLKYFEVDKYFKVDADDRKIEYNKFNFSIFSNLKNILTEDEKKELDKLNHDYLDRLKKLSPTIIQKETERLIIELSWKSSQIEGNTYSLIDTEILLKENKEALGHKKSEATMLLNHKKALDFIFLNKEKFKKIKLQDIENIHKLTVMDLNIGYGVRKTLVGITGTKYRPLDNQYQIKEALEKMVITINKIKHPIEKALIANLIIAYIQPFEDGNKRTSRLIANSLLIANNYCPLSFRSINEGDYKKAVILFYEQNSASYFKDLFIKQIKFSLNNYFQK